MNNRWNGLLYKIWAPIYDKFFNTGKFLKARKELFQEQLFDIDQKILFVGVGTGADLERINYKELNITAIDYSSDMLKKASEKFKGSAIHFLKMDAQDMNFTDNHFDIVIGSLVLSVVPDANKCLIEMSRVLKPNGEMIIFDKFTPKGNGLTPFQRAIRPFIKLLGTDIGINFEELFEKHKDTLFVKQDISIMFNGMYRKIIISKLDS